MFQIGDSLREARTRRGLSAADVQKGIRIRERYLTALEEERWEMLPGEAYIKGFLRTYAEFLGLNGQLYVDEFNSRVARREDEPLLVPDSLAGRRGGRGGPALRVAVGAVLLGALVAGLAAWRLGGSSTTAQPTTLAGSRTSAAPAAPAQTPAATPPASKPAAPAKPAVAVISAARGRCWLSVRVGGPTGRVLYENTLTQGQTLRYPLKQALWLRMGNPLALDIRVGATPVTGLPALPSNLLLKKTPAG